ncbi:MULTISPECIES: beta-N-acetylhexosaminidase [Microbacterium]|uniref:beta-N-acetylhexosaminidase n=1 Tax=Microbacterium wangchenii TaxID=2541726 RepID=A0ABX5SS44_9MICO|nr:MULTISPECIES: beta-N-acetylhexosaminidase [Microbacterium]MCK6066641.1 beta-N-acetylhexosaminidase [Microbacterium sp. EYE_512]QBR87973.1 beta-N-acetylhexosaminidase [Microbacterium wangchenii]TXK18237.1 family 20 glycosylhydrolase [Microbacterium wangchenii]
MPTPTVVPFPAALRTREGAPFPLAGATVAGDADAAAELSRLVRARTGIEPARAASGSIRLRVAADGPDDPAAPESYVLTVEEASVTVTGADAAGLFYGVQTLAQLLRQQEGAWVLPPVEIEDAPRFAYRGVMLDVARHFFGVQAVMSFIDRAASLKCNHLHLHLTDDQGWRLQLRSRPELTARAAGTAVGGDDGGFYTQEDYARILAHAASRHVTIVPEIDIPGHTHAVGLAYPDIAADPVLTDEVRADAEAAGAAVPVAGQPYTGIAVGFSSLRIGDARTDAFLADVFGELAALTPGPYLHLGGDEALGTDRADYAAVIARTVGIIAAAGKTAIAWHEAAAVEPLPAGLVAQYWGFVTPSPSTTAARASSVILSPSDAAYLDMKPDADFPLGLMWADGPTSVQRAYEWEPAGLLPGVEPGDILGVEAPLWTETVRTPADIDALVFPRLAAVAEIGWSPAPSASAARTWESFRARVGGLGPLWSALGIAFTASPEIPWQSE